ncbi:MAG: hypothetical protein J5692_00315 [Bacteroidales bacterium]|nr:hypothetical protein [Bacteroidales bacterium]
MRVVAHLEYGNPNLGRLRNIICVGCSKGGYVADYNVATNTFGMSSPGDRVFLSPHASVYDVIRRIREAIPESASEEDRAFALRLCDLAYDEINPKLF